MSTSMLNEDASAILRIIERRNWLLAKEQWLTSDEVAARIRCAVEKANSNQPAYQLRLSGRLLGVLAERKRLHPAFQFIKGDDGLLEPHPAMKALLQLLPPDGIGWTQVLWFFQPTSRLEGKRPADVPHEHANDVITAAKKEFRVDEGI